MRTASVNRVWTALLLGAAAAGVLCSCEKDRTQGPDEGRTRVSFVVGTPSTRAAVTEHEDDIVSLDVLVYRADDGGLDAHHRVEGSGLTGISAEVTANVPMHWHVVANAPRSLGSFLTEERFLNSVTFFTDGTFRSLVMHAAGSVTVREEDNAPVRAVLDRYTSKVTVETLSVKWLESFSTPPSVMLERIVLVNVVGSTPWSGIPAAGDVWYNKMGVDASLGEFEEDMLVKEYGSRSVTSSAAFDVASPLYCMPNPVTNSLNSVNAPAWSPRNTRVAVELKVDGVSNWYPVDLPAMQCNRHYLLRGFTVTGPGSDSPDKPVSRDDVAFTVEILPWGENTINPVFTAE